MNLSINYDNVIAPWADHRYMKTVIFGPNYQSEWDEMIEMTFRGYHHVTMHVQFKIESDCYVATSLEEYYRLKAEYHDDFFGTVLRNPVC